MLDEEGLEPADHDVLLPAAEQVLADGDGVVLSRARPLELTVDGVSREVYVTALSVDEALEQLGFRTEGLVLSASRSERLPLKGMQLTITTPKSIVLVSDGQERVVSTTAATAGDLLAEQGIALSETDRTSLYLTQGLLNRMRLQVYRVQVSEVSETVAVEPERVETPDPNAFKGDEKVTTPGVAGEQVTVYRVTVVDGVETAREALSTQVTREPVAEQVAVGTKARPANAPAGDGGDWAALAECESGGNWASQHRQRHYGGLPVLHRHVAGVGGQRDAAPRPRRERADLPRAAALSAPAPASGRTAAARRSADRASPEHAAEQPDGLLGPAAIRDLAQQLELRSDEVPRAELPARREHDPADRAHRRAAPGRRRPGGRPRPRLADPRAAPGRRAGDRGRDRPAAGGAAALTVAARTPHLADRLTVVEADALRLPGCPAHPDGAGREPPVQRRRAGAADPAGAFPTLDRALILVQAEVAERLAAGPGTDAYGVPSVKAAWYGEVRRAGSVGRRVFWPEPNVDSGLVALVRRPPPAGDRPPPSP